MDLPLKKKKLRIIDTPFNSTQIVLKPSSQSKTQKKKNDISYKEKSKLWDIYDLDKQAEGSNNNSQIECVYTTPKDNDKCMTCNSPLIIMDDGFPTCTNDKCGIIYRDIGMRDKAQRVFQTLVDFYPESEFKIFAEQEIQNI